MLNPLEYLTGNQNPLFKDKVLAIPITMGASMYHNTKDTVSVRKSFTSLFKVLTITQRYVGLMQILLIWQVHKS